MDSVDIHRALVVGGTLAAVSYAMPSSTEEGKPKRSPKKALMVGATMAVASAVNDMAGLSASIPISDSSMGMVPGYVARRAVADGLIFAAVQAVANKKQRKGKRGLMNFLYGAGAAVVADLWVTPEVSNWTGPPSAQQNDPGMGPPPTASAPMSAGMP